MIKSHYAYKHTLTELKHYISVQEGVISHNEIKHIFQS